MLKAYIEQIIPCAYTILGIESFIIFSMCFRHPKALVSTMPALIAFWNIGVGLHSIICIYMCLHILRSLRC